ncbi:MAG TPA: hypothetical protein DCS89_06560, partial [Gammaproteobacteria bacterium]|nr:hypothetical protein [Gammaproteobacteria bacterium]
MNKLDSSNKGADRSQLATDLLKQIGVDEKVIQTGDLIVSSPVDGLPLGQVKTSSAAAVDSAIAQSVQAYEQWKTVPAPRRGELIRVFGNKLREHKQTLGALVTMECGKIYQEALGEVQEMID